MLAASSTALSWYGVRLSVPLIDIVSDVQSVHWFAAARARAADIDR